MSNFSQILTKVAQRSAPAVAQPGDYLEDGLRFCGKCHTAKEARLPIPGGDLITVPCLCHCATAARDSQRDALHRQEVSDHLERLRSDGITSQRLRTATFETADGGNQKAMDTLRRYVNAWPDVYRNNIGLLLFGDVGTGKSFGAACVANSLLGQGVPTFMTDFASILSQLSASFEKAAYLDRLANYPLLILDDFGVERDTSFALEQVYNIVNRRYLTQKPLIVTTNLDLSQLKNPADTAHKRIFDRILEMCQPVNFGTNGRREALASEKLSLARKLLSGDVERPKSTENARGD